MDLVIDFCRHELAGVGGDGVQFSLVVFLGQYSTEGEVRGVGFDKGCFLRVEV